MRDILFKAKAINRDSGYHRTNYKNGDWVYGLVTSLYDERFENLPAEMTDLNGVSGIEIDHNTICQYTGLYDSTKWEDLSEKEQRAFLDEGNLPHEWKGKKIWENDVVEVKNDKHHFISQIEWDNWCKGFMFQDTKTTACGMDAISDSGCYRFGCKVIGNIFDNPELIGE